MTIWRNKLIAAIGKRRLATLPELPKRADAIVIGGGSIGCSTLYHLTKFGLKNVVLLERNQITSGTTWHTAGLLWRLRPNDADVELIAHTRDLNKTILPEETGQTAGWIENGGLFIASTDERLKEYKRLMTLGRCYGIESRVLSPSESKDLYPLLNIDDLRGTLYSPGDGLIEPSTYCSSLIKAARLNGAHVFENCPVTDIETKTDDFGIRKVHGVHTSRGFIETSAVVNCAGAWAVRIGRMVNVQVPLLAMKHAYVTTERVEGIRNMPNVRDHDSSIYLKLQGDALAIGGYEPNPIFIDDGVTEDFAFSLYDLDWNVFGVHIESATKRVPALRNIGVKSEVCGPESFTPDHKPLMGETPELRGFFLNCGYNSAGMMLSGGCGREMARTVATGRPALHMHHYDIARFAPQLTGKKSWLRERSHESYANNYRIVWPYDEPLAGRNGRKGALYDTLLNKGCVYQERFGWERPGWFHSDRQPAPALQYDYQGHYGQTAHKTDRYADLLGYDYTFEQAKTEEFIGRECKECRERAAVFDMSYFGKFYLSGKDAQKSVDWLFSNDLRREPGRTVYTCMLNDRGGVEADLTVSVLDETDRRTAAAGLAPPDLTAGSRWFYVAAGGAIAEHVRRHLLTGIADRRFDVRLDDRSDRLALISLQGRDSRRVLQPLIDADLNELPFGSCRLVNLCGRGDWMARLIRLSFVGELGYELHLPNEYAVPVYEKIMSQGGVADAGYRAIDALSLEKGYRLWGTDLRLTDTPLEAGLGFTCKLKSDVDFKGRSALELQQEEGITKKLVCFTLDKHRPLWGLETIYRNGKPVGFVRRGDFAYTLNKPMAVGYVSNGQGTPVLQDWLKSGRYEIESMGDRFPATAHFKSPFDPQNLRLKGQYESL